MRHEFDLIADIRRMFPAPAGTVGIGDDCAVIPQHDGLVTLVSTDMLVEGSHFLLEDISPYRLGWKSAAVNFSDIAAMGGSPAGSFLALALPPALSGNWTDEFLRGYREVSGKYGFPLLGGDTTASKDRLCICVTVLGYAPAGKAVMRNGAEPGDLVCVTGSLGDSAAGLHSILHPSVSENDFAETLKERHYLPQPRIREGLALASVPGVHSMMDISDGIGSDLKHIMEESGTGVEIDLSKIPLSEELLSYCSANGMDALDFALDGGEDYELLFAVTPDALEHISGLWNDSLIPYTVIGKITENRKLTWLGTDRDYTGFRHF